MIFLHSSRRTLSPWCDGSSVLFDVCLDGEQIPCAISRMALEDIAGRYTGRITALLDRFAEARERIEEIVLGKLHVRPAGVLGRLRLWVADEHEPPPAGGAGGALVQVASRSVNRAFEKLKQEVAMAKGQKRSNREAKKPKAPVKKPASGATAGQYKLSIKPQTVTGAGR